MKNHLGFLASFYNSTAGLLRRIETTLDTTVRFGAVYGRKAVARRLLQEIAVLLVAPLRRENARRAFEGEPPLESLGGTLRCSRLEIDPRSGRVRSDLALCVQSTGRFLVHWLAVLALAVPALRGGRRRGPATVVLGVPEESLFPADDAPFAEYARSGPIAPLNEARFLLIQTLRPDARSTDGARIGYTRHPFLELARANPLDTAGFAAFLLQHLRTLFAFLGGVLRFPVFALLWRDYAHYALIASLNERRLIEAIVLTVTHSEHQWLWMTDLPQRHFATHMVFYSMNDRPPVYLDIEERCAAHPTQRLIRADHFWVWTEGQAAVLKSEGIVAEMHAVGPIMWVLHRPVSRPDEPWISVFDVTPFTPAVNRELGLLGNYFGPDNLLAFLDGLEQAAAAADVQTLVIKPKRTPTDWHDPRYLSRVREGKRFRLLPPETSAYSVIASSALVIVYPYSSVAYAADALGVPAVYFDPTGRLAPTYEPRPHISFAGDVKALENEMRRALNH